MLDRFDKKWQRNGHTDGSGDGQVGMGAWAEVLDAVVFDVPDRRVGRDGKLRERHAAEQFVVDRLDAVTVDDAGEAAPRCRDERGQPLPADVDVVLGTQGKCERGNLVGGDAGRERAASRRPGMGEALVAVARTGA
jgi:hypothetical protein